MTWGLEDEFPLKSDDFQGPTVNLPEGKPFINYNGFSHYLKGLSHLFTTKRMVETL